VATTPTVRGVTEGAGASSTTHSITFTQTTGDRVVIFLAFDATARTLSTVGDSFTNLTNTSATFHILTKVLDGSEGGTMDVTIAVASKSAWLAYNITTGTHASGTAPVFSTVATGTSTAPNSATLSPSGGSAKYLWLSAFDQRGEEADDDTWTSAAPSTPGTFTGLVQKTTGTSGAVTVNGSVAAAQYAAETATVDPGAFTVAQSLAWRAYTVAIYPFTTTDYTQTAGDSIGTLSETNVRTTGRVRTGADSLGTLSEAVARIAARFRTAADAISGGGTAQVRHNFVTDTDGWLSCEWAEAGIIEQQTYLGQDVHLTEESIETGETTWQTWGVPTGATVTSIEIVKIRSRCLNAYNVTIPPVRLTDGNITDIAALTDTETVQTWFTDITHAAVTLSESSDDPVEMIVPFDLYGTGAIYQFQFEAIWFDITYTGGGGITEAAVGVKTAGEGTAKVRTSGDTLGTLSEATARAFVGTRAVAGTTIGTLSEAATRIAARVRTVAGESIGTLSEASTRAFVGTRTVAGSTVGTLSEATTRAFVGSRSASATVGTLSEASVRVIGWVRTAGDSIGTLSETAVRAVIARVRTAGDTIGTLSEAAARAVANKVRSAGDTVGTLSESVVRVIGWVRSVGDSLGTLSEAAVRAQKAWARSTGDTIGTLSEAAVRAVAAKVRAAGDTVGTLTEAAVRIAARARTAAETVGTLSEATARAFIGSRAVSDGLATLSEAVVGVKSGVQAWVATAGDAIGTLTEAAVRAFVGTRSAGDSIGSLSEAAARIAARARAAGDTVGTLSEAAIRAAIDRVRIAGDTVGTLSETAVRAAAAKMRAAGDTVGTLSEAVVGVKSGVVAWVATASDAIGSLGESIVRAFAGSRTVGDTVGTLTEAAVRIAARARAAGDSIPTLGEAVSRLGAFLRPVGDTVPTLTEVVVGVQAGLHAFVRAASDVIGSLLESAGWPVNPGGAGPRGTAGRTGIDATASHDEPSGTATRATSAGTAGHDEPDATAAHQEPRV